MLATRTGFIDHLAFSATGLSVVKARFDAAGIVYELRSQAGALTWQLFSTDPNGAKVELDVDPSETLWDRPWRVRRCGRDHAGHAGHAGHADRAPAARV